MIAFLCSIILVTCFVVTQIQTITVVLVPTITSLEHSAGEIGPIISSTTTSSLIQSESASFEETVLSLHNEKRELHHAQLLVWNNTLYDYAANYANQYDCSGNLVHSGGAYGENLAIGYSPGGAVDAWYNEGNTYDYSSGDLNHFTAVIWAETTSLGCASKYCGSVWHNYIICLYYPAGNVIGRAKENVLPI